MDISVSASDLCNFLVTLDKEALDTLSHISTATGVSPTTIVGVFIIRKLQLFNDIKNAYSEDELREVTRLTLDIR